MADAPPAWTVVSQVETVDLGPAGAFVAGVRVSFTTAAGATGSVFVPSDQYTVERVRAAINAKAETLDAIAELRG
jgi:hypothetical protein